MRILRWFFFALSSGILIASASGAPLFPFDRIQEQSGKPDEPAEMQMIGGGFLMINTPKGWDRVQGSGLAFFLEKGVDAADAKVWIYVSGSPIGEGESIKSRKDYIQSDIKAFKERFKDGIVREEEPLELPKAKTKVPVVSFESGQAHNAFERVVYIEEQKRVLTLVLSAKNREVFEKTLPLFQEFAQSYGGSVTLTPDAK
jgi:hypothetical protein